jgi:hypothetical protein
MHFRTSLQRNSSLARFTPPRDTEASDPVAWKAKLVARLPPLHDRSPFEQLVSDYLIEDKTPDLSILVCECMKHGNVDVLAYVLAKEDIKSLRIGGAINERGWKTLAKAMPDNLLVEDLHLSSLGLSFTKIKLLFHAMSQMPALKSLELWGVHVKPSIFFDQLQCSPRTFEKLNVNGCVNPKFGVYGLLRKLFEACQFREVSISGPEFSIHKHTKLAELLKDQPLLQSLRLEIDERETPEEFECYMPLLCGKTAQPLARLELNRCCIGAANLNKLIEALPQNQPALESFFLTDCSRGESMGGGKSSINLLPLAEMKSLTYLDLSKNRLPMRATLALLKAWTEKPTRLAILNLSGNSIGKETVYAITSLLRETETLRGLSLETSALKAELDLVDPVVMLGLVEAVEHNRSLLEFQFRWDRDLDEYRASVNASLVRNRQAFRQADMQTAAAFTMPLLLQTPWGGEVLPPPQLPQLPGDMIHHIIQHGRLTARDAATLSSLNHETRAAHEEFLRKTGS